MPTSPLAALIQLRAMCLSHRRRKCLHLLLAQQTQISVALLQSLLPSTALRITIRYSIALATCLDILRVPAVSQQLNQNLAGQAFRSLYPLLFMRRFPMPKLALVPLHVALILRQPVRLSWEMQQHVHSQQLQWVARRYLELWWTQMLQP